MLRVFCALGFRELGLNSLSGEQAFRCRGLELCLHSQAAPTNFMFGPVCRVVVPKTIRTRQRGCVAVSLQCLLPPCPLGNSTRSCRPIPQSFILGPCWIPSHIFVLIKPNKDET